MAGKKKPRRYPIPLKRGQKFKKTVFGRKIDLYDTWPEFNKRQKRLRFRLEDRQAEQKRVDKNKRKKK